MIYIELYTNSMLQAFHLRLSCLPSQRYLGEKNGQFSLKNLMFSLSSMGTGNRSYMRTMWFLGCSILVILRNLDMK